MTQEDGVPALRSRRSCPVCEGHDSAPLHRQRLLRFEDHPLTGGHDVAHCENCGAAYADIGAMQIDYDKYFAEFSKYDNPASSKGSGESPLDRKRLDRTAEILTGYLPFHSRILDVGCADVGLLAALQRRGYRKLVGVDPPETCAQLPRERIGAAWQGWLGKLPSGIGIFDCVVLYHVVERILDVPKTLDILRRLLSDQGIVYVEVPDAVCDADPIYASFQEFNTQHIHRFSRRCLDNALGRRGLVPAGGGARIFCPAAHTSMPAVHGVYQWRGECLCRTGIDFRAAIRKKSYFNHSGGLTLLNRPREPLGFHGRSPWPDFWC